jgi:hypothetical protein
MPADESINILKVNELIPDKSIRVIGNFWHAEFEKLSLTRDQKNSDMLDGKLTLLFSRASWISLDFGDTVATKKEIILYLCVII